MNHERLPWSICDGCGMSSGNASTSGHLIPSLFRTCICSNLWHQFFQTCCDFPNFSLWIYLSTFSILLHTTVVHDPSMGHVPISHFSKCRKQKKSVMAALSFLYNYEAILGDFRFPFYLSVCPLSFPHFSSKWFVIHQNIKLYRQLQYKLRSNRSSLIFWWFDGFG